MNVKVLPSGSQQVRILAVLDPMFAQPAVKTNALDPSFLSSSANRFLARDAVWKKMAGKTAPVALRDASPLIH